MGVSPYEWPYNRIAFVTCTRRTDGDQAEQALPRFLPPLILVVTSRRDPVPGSLLQRSERRPTRAGEIGTEKRVHKLGRRQRRTCNTTEMGGRTARTGVSFSSHCARARAPPPRAASQGVYVQPRFQRAGISSAVARRPY